jgi:hypothetical protein
MKCWKVTKSHVLLAQMNKLHDIYRCLKVHGKISSMSASSSYVQIVLYKKSDRPIDA